MVRGRLAKPRRTIMPSPLPSPAVTGRAVDVEALLPARAGRPWSTGNGNSSAKFSVRSCRCRAADLRRDGRAPPCPAPAAAPSGRRRRTCSAERLVLRLVVHVLPAAGHGQTACHAASTSASRALSIRSRACQGSTSDTLARHQPLAETTRVVIDRTAGRWPRCRGRSGRELARAKRGTLKTGWYGIGKAVQRQHAEHGGQRGEQERGLEGDRDERRPAVERPPADVDRVGNHRRSSTAGRSPRARR